MTQEQAIEIIKKNMPSDKSLPVYEALQTLIPELAESEDERMKRIIMKFVWGYTNTPHSIINGDKSTLEYAKEVEAYLEKQKEQKPAEWSEEDKEMLLSIINAFRNGTVSTIGQEQWLKSLHKRFNLQPKQEWSDEDKTAFKYLHRLISFGFAEKFIDAQTAHDMREWLNTRFKSLRPSWKPSEEQMEALDEYIYAKDPNTEKYSKAVLSLRDDLKKLM